MKTHTAILTCTKANKNIVGTKEPGLVLFANDRMVKTVNTRYKNFLFIAPRRITKMRTRIIKQKKIIITKAPYIIYNVYILLIFALFTTLFLQK